MSHRLLLVRRKGECLTTQAATTCFCTTFRSWSRENKRHPAGWDLKLMKVYGVPCIRTRNMISHISVHQKYLRHQLSSIWCRVDSAQSLQHTRCAVDASRGIPSSLRSKAKTASNRLDQSSRTTPSLSHHRFPSSLRQG